ncbi:4120_t:CDS:2, partial [Acaulospora morrowiae]
IKLHKEVSLATEVGEATIACIFIEFNKTGQITSSKQVNKNVLLLSLRTYHLSYLIWAFQFRRHNLHIT